MFSIKGLKKEDLVVVATELGLKVEIEHRIVDLKTLIEGSDQFANDAEFVKEFLITTVSDRLEKEKREAELLKIEKENVKSEQNTALELERTKLEVIKAQLEMAKITDVKNLD